MYKITVNGALFHVTYDIESAMTLSYMAENEQKIAKIFSVCEEDTTLVYETQKSICRFVRLVMKEDHIAKDGECESLSCHMKWRRSNKNMKFVRYKEVLDEENHWIYLYYKTDQQVSWQKEGF